MNALLVLNDGLRVIVKLHTKSLQKEVVKLLEQGNNREAATLVKCKAEVQKPLVQGTPVPAEYGSLLKLVE